MCRTVTDDFRVNTSLHVKCDTGVVVEPEERLASPKLKE